MERLLEPRFWVSHTEPGYYLLLLPAVMLYWLVPARHRVALLAGLSVLYAALVVRQEAALLLALLLFVHARGRALARVRAADPPGEPPRLAPALALLVGVLVLLKGLVLAAQLLSGGLPLYDPTAVSAEGMILPLGLSFGVFRLIHLLVEMQRGRVEPPDLRALLAYVLFFPLFLAGPLERYPRFVAQERLDAALVNGGLLRILGGVAKKLIVVQYLLGGLCLPWIGAQYGGTLPGVVLAAYALILLLWLDFSAYSDVAIGTSKLFGYTICENFDYPLLRPNIGEFWRTWHMSLYSFIRDYFFFPLFGRATSRKKLLLGVFLSLTVFHLWHGFTLNYLLLGAYHGLLMASWTRYTRWKRQKRRPDLLPGRAGKVVGTMLTATLVAAGSLLFFWGPQGLPLGLG